MYRAYIRKLVRSPLFYIGIVGVLAICFTRTFHIKNLGHAKDVLREVEYFLYFDNLQKAVVIFGALPFTTNFADEWKCGVTAQCVSRIGASKYAVSNIVVCFGSTFATVLIGMMLYSGIYSTFYPFYISDGNTFGTPYEIFIQNGTPILYLISLIFVYAASCGMWAVMGLMMSALLPNKYIAICTPFAASYAIERVTMGLPPALNLWSISISALSWNGISLKNALLTIFYSTGFSCIIAGICGVFFTVTVKRRIRCEIT